MSADLSRRDRIAATLAEHQIIETRFGATCGSPLHRENRCQWVWRVGQALGCYQAHRAHVADVIDRDLGPESVGTTLTEWGVQEDGDIYGPWSEEQSRLDIKIRSEEGVCGALVTRTITTFADQTTDWVVADDADLS